MENSKFQVPMSGRGFVAAAPEPANPKIHSWLYGPFYSMLWAMKPTGDQLRGADCLGGARIVNRRLRPVLAGLRPDRRGHRRRAPADGDSGNPGARTKGVDRHRRAIEGRAEANARVPGGGNGERK